LKILKLERYCALSEIDLHQSNQHVRVQSIERPMGAWSNQHVRKQSIERPMEGIQDAPKVKAIHRLADSGISNSSDLPPVPYGTFYATQKSPNPPFEIKQRFNFSDPNLYELTDSSPNFVDIGFSSAIPGLADTKKLGEELSNIDLEIQKALAAADNLQFDFD